MMCLNDSCLSWAHWGEKPPYLHVLIATLSQFERVSSLLHSGLGMTFCVDGKNCRTWKQLYWECGKAISSPARDYIPNYPYAFQEDLDDINGWMPAESYVFAIANADTLLDREAGKDWDWFCDMVIANGRQWGKVNSQSEVQDYWQEQRQPTPFHFILHVCPERERVFLARIRNIPPSELCYCTLPE